jgi:hypothetical protein
VGSQDKHHNACRVMCANVRLTLLTLLTHSTWWCTGMVLLVLEQAQQPDKRQRGMTGW